MVTYWIYSEVKSSKFDGEIRALLLRSWEVQFVHVFKEGNRAADVLANESLSFARDLRIVDFPSSQLQKVLPKDKVGVGLQREPSTYPKSPNAGATTTQEEDDNDEVPQLVAGETIEAASKEGQATK
ncbi:hypothetical protein PTKIN_Ptkin09bG0187700 [Pterospermum kingtungense]